MLTPRHFRVFVSSPGDVTDERDAARDVLRDVLPVSPSLRGRATFDAVTWDDPNAPTPMLAQLSPQAAVNRGLPRPSECDIVIVILWSRMGTPLPEEERKEDGSRYVSGTEYEYLDALSQARLTGSPKILVYRRTTIPQLPINLSPKESEEAREQWSRVETFFAGFKNADGSLQAGHHEHKSPEDFRKLVSHHLEALVQSMLAADDRQASPPGSARPTSLFSPPKLGIREVAKQLNMDLDWIDQDFSFDSSWFTPLDAKVRVRQAGKTEDRVSDLLSELASSASSQPRLVLGLPGAGKSVAMREFARRKLRDAGDDGVLPIYVNLRDWIPERVWTEKEPPTRRELEAFLQQRLSFPTKPAMTAYFSDFRRQHADGRLYWIFDSFDELPAILDAGAGRADELVKSVARLLFEFVMDNSRPSETRGIIASRYERKPDFPASLITLIELQPFDDHQIRAAFARNEKFPKALADDIFRPPGNLVALARTPFYHALVVDFAISNMRLPETTAELFDSFVEGRLASSSGASPGQPDARTNRILWMAEDIAAYLFASKQYGLGCPVGILEKELQQQDFQDGVSRLKSAKILRIGALPDEILTFSHRRMHEYFLVRHKIRTRVPFDIEWVARDTRDRDSAVLHVELVDNAECRAIAGRCWQEMLATASLSYDTPEFYRGINCQRFLAEAFRTRRSAVEPISAELEAHIIECLRGADVIRAKLAAESIGLLSQSGLEQAVALAVSRGEFWVRDTAIDACRFLLELPPSVRGSIWRLIVVTEEANFISDRARLKFSFGLSPSLREVSDLIDRRAEDIHRWKWTWPIAALLAPFPLFLEVLDSLRRFAFGLLVKGDDNESGQRQLSRITLKFLNSKHIEPGDLSSLSVVGMNAFRAAFLSISVVVTNVAGVGAVGFFLLITALRPEWFKITSGLDYFASLQILAGPLIFFGWLGFGGIAARYLASIRFPLHVSGEAIDYRRQRDYIGAVRRAFGAIADNAVAFVVGVAVFFLVLHLSGYVIHSAWIARLADFFDIYNLAFGFGGLMLVGAVIGASEQLKNVLMWLRDQRRFKRAQQEQAHDREQICSMFSSFETPSYRERYVDLLASQAVRPVGRWPEGAPPNRKDVASVKLARLEHDWRGLNK